MPQTRTEGVYCHDRRLEEGLVCSIHLLFRSAQVLLLFGRYCFNSVKMHDF